jgi:release factor glutamine methyltransferase
MLSQKIKIEEIISDFKEELKGCSPSPLGEIEYMIMSIKSLPDRSLIYISSLTFGEQEMNKLKEMVELRKKGIPLQYILGEVDFYGFRFRIQPGVFIPRPETEIMVDYIIQNYSNCKGLKILEIGTGSGVIAICLTKFLPESKIIATDINTEALEVAKRNAGLHRVRVSLIRADLFNFLSWRAKFDLIVSNPPYVGREEYKFLAPDVKMEPQEALVGGKLGYEFTLNLITQAFDYIKPGGKVIVEIDYRAKKIYQKELGKEYKLEFLNDFNSRERVMIVEKKDG